MNRTRVLYLTITSEIGGSDLTILRVIRHLDKGRFQTFMVFPKDGPLVPEFAKAGCAPVIVPMMKLRRTRDPRYFAEFFARFVPTVLALARIIRQRRIDIVHSNTMHNLYGWAAALATGRRHVWHIREIPIKPRWVRWLEAFLVKHFSHRIVVMSEAIADLYRGKRGIDPRVARKMRKVYDGVDISEFSPQVSGERIRREMGLSADTPLVGMVTRLDPWKGVDVFIRAAAMVSEEMPEARFLIAGGPIEGRERYGRELGDLAEGLGLDGRLLFAGWRYKYKDIPEVMNALDVHVHASTLPEPYGLTNIEAMACGTVTIASDLGGPRELVEHGISGVLVEPGAPGLLARAILDYSQERWAR